MAARTLTWADTLADQNGDTPANYTVSGVPATANAVAGDTVIFNISTGLAVPGFSIAHICAILQISVAFNFEASLTDGGDYHLWATSGNCTIGFSIDDPALSGGGAELHLTLPSQVGGSTAITVTPVDPGALSGVTGDILFDHMCEASASGSQCHLLGAVTLSGGEVTTYTGSDSNTYNLIHQPAISGDLTGPNYTQAPVTYGTLTMSGPSRFGNASIAGNAVLNYGSDADSPFYNVHILSTAGVFSGNGTSMSGISIMAGANVTSTNMLWTGTTVLSGGSLSLAGSGGLFRDSAVVNAGGSISFFNGATFYNATIAGSWSVNVGTNSAFSPCLGASFGASSVGVVHGTGSFIGGAQANLALAAGAQISIDNRVAFVTQTGASGLQIASGAAITYAGASALAIVAGVTPPAGFLPLGLQTAPAANLIAAGSSFSKSDGSTLTGTLATSGAALISPRLRTALG